MGESDSEDSVVPHACIELPAGGKEPARKALSFRVGPPVSWTFERIDGRGYVVLWGSNLSQKWLRKLSEACHNVKRELSDMDMPMEANEASKMETAFLNADILPNECGTENTGATHTKP